MKNSHCVECNNRTKIFLKLPGRMKFTFICKQATSCPFTRKQEGEETKLRSDLW